MLPVPKRLGGGKAISQSHVRSPKQEREAAIRIGGTVTKASGAGAFEKGDVRLNGVARIEAKTTKHSSFRVTSDMINKIEGFAVQAGEVPAMLIEIDGGARSVYVVPVWAFEGLLDQKDDV